MSRDMNNITDPIRKRKLSDHVQERLLAIIQSGELAPGDTFPSERELMTTYSVGRPAVREAMQNLQRMGLVEIRHGERPKIAEPSFERIVGQLGETMLHFLTHSSTSMEHLKEARLVLEVEMVRVAAQQRTPEDIERLKVVLAKQENAKLDTTEFLFQDGLFHQEIAKISGNPIFEGLSKSLFEWLTRFHLDLVLRPGLEKSTLDEHYQILAAIEVGDPDAAAQRLSEHLNRVSSLYHQNHLQSKK